MTPNKKYLLIIIILSLALIASVFLVVRVTSTYNKAATTSSKNPIVLENSYLFASPLQAKADGKEQIRLTVFLLDGRGLGVANQSVTIDIPQTISINNSQEITDENGKAIFDLSSPVAQTISITAKSNGLSLPQKVKLIFY
ncbi:MAG: Ig-like domain-containing protein [Candidatus Shapirobacteria bacterium]